MFYVVNWILYCLFINTYNRHDITEILFNVASGVKHHNPLNTYIVAWYDFEIFFFLYILF